MSLIHFAVGPHADLRGRDTCETCAHAVMRRVWSLEHRMCDHPEVVERREGSLVSAGIARDEDCGGKLWERRR